jgi:UDP-glucose 4-epimerase
MQTILITGGLGFIGSNLAQYLAKKNKIIIIDNMSHGILENIKNTNNIQIYKKDITKNEFTSFLETFNKKIDIIFHLAAISSLPECQSFPIKAYENNILGTINVLEMARKYKVKKTIFASTSAIYENYTDFPCNEMQPVLPEPRLIYSLTKLQGEQLCESYVKNYGLNISIIRFFNVYGPNQNSVRKSPPLTIYVIDCLLKNIQPTLHHDGTQKRDYVYIDDLIDLCEKVMNYNENILVNACSGKVISVKEIYY